MSIEMIDLPLFYQKLFLEIQSWLVGVALTEIGNFEPSIIHYQIVTYQLHLLEKI